MPRGKKELAEQIIPRLREVEVEVGRGKIDPEAVKKIGMTASNHGRVYSGVPGARWREDVVHRARFTVGKRLRGELLSFCSGTT